MQTKLSRVFILAAGIAGISITHANCEDPVWVWSNECLNPTNVRIQVRLDGKTIYSSSITICKTREKLGYSRDSFKFTPTRSLVWYGYRSDQNDGKKDLGESTPKGTTFEVDLWQARGENDAILLGYMVSAKDGIHMNSIHILSPSKKRVSTMAPGLVLETWPVKK